MGEAIKKLTNEQIKFICEECGVMTDELLTLGEDDLYNRVYEKLCDVEIETIPDDDSEEETDVKWHQTLLRCSEKLCTNSINQKYSMVRF